MAGEVQGSIFEAITRFAAEKAVSGSKPRKKVFFHEKPDWISIDPDIAIGRKKNDIESLLLVTHTISERMTEKKFWRNAAELFQWKVQGPRVVRVIDVVFVSKFKPALKKVSESIMDSVLDLGEKDHGKRLIKHAEKNANAYGSSEESRYEKTKLFYAEDEAYKSSIDLFTKDIKAALSNENTVLVPLWKLERSLYKEKGISPTVKQTCVRNGLARLMLLDADVRELVYQDVLESSGIPFELIPEYAISLGLIEEDLGEGRITDIEIKSVIELLGKDKCEALISRIPERMKQYIAILQAPANNKSACDYVVRNFKTLASPSGMRQALTDCYEDPFALMSEVRDVERPPVDNWLFVFCMTVDKALAGKVTAYGLSNLARETGIPAIGSLGGVLITPFINREKPLRSDIMTEVSKVFANKLKEVGKKTLESKSFKTSMEEMLLQRQNYTLKVYRFFDPLLDLIKEALEDAGITYTINSVPTVFKEIAVASAATSRFVIVGDGTLIAWQSVTDAGRVHKTKELSARFRATIAEYTGGKFRARKIANRIYFVADGDWQEEDFATLVRSGVDRIFYPDQMEELVAEIGREAK